MSLFGKIIIELKSTICVNACWVRFELSADISTMNLLWMVGWQAHFSMQPPNLFTYTAHLGEIPNFMLHGKSRICKKLVGIDR
jgi:hypothetical protein